MSVFLTKVWDHFHTKMFSWGILQKFNFKNFDLSHLFLKLTMLTKIMFADNYQALQLRRVKDEQTSVVLMGSTN